MLMAASEAVPFSKTGGLADVIGALPAALAASGIEVAVVLPRYKTTRLARAKTVVESMTIPLGDGLHFPRILEAPRKNKVRTLLVDYPPYFDRDSLYVAANGRDYPDNPERFSLFSRAVLEIAKSLFRPDILHCHDWQAGLAPVLLRTAYAGDPGLENLRAILTIHNLGHQGLFPAASLARAGLAPELFRMQGLEFYGQVNFLKGAMIYSDWITTVSRKYAQEMQTPEYGFGLDGVLGERRDQITGILNGADYGEWDPARDRHIAARYAAGKLEGKRRCKLDLLREFGFPDSDAKLPLIGIISRLTRQKGADLIAEVADRLFAEKVRLVVLGTGEPRYERLFTHLASQYPGRMAVRVAYDNVLAHKIEAGADMFLMPSYYEPCGLNQIYSLRYGTVPIVRATGGLEDTIEQFDPATGEGTGFKFTSYSGTALLGAITRALGVYQDPELWPKLIGNGMAMDFSWDRAVAGYQSLYKTLAGSSAPGQNQE